MRTKHTQSETTINTPELRIQGNIMLWYGTMIQLSNVSYISTQGLPSIPFPAYSLIGILVGLFLFENHPVFSLLLFCATGGWIYYWYEKNLTIKCTTSLNIQMNSGTTLQFIIRNKEFLEKILAILEKIIIDGGIGSQQIAINIKDCNISGNAHVLDELKINK